MYFLLICTISSIMLANAKQTYVNMTPEAIAIMSEKSITCIEETGADSNTFQRVLQWQFDKDEITKKFYFCLFRNIGLTDDSGSFYIDQVLDLYRNSNRKDEIQPIAERCNELQENNPLDTMYVRLQCFAKETPELLLFNIN